MHGPTKHKALMGHNGGPSLDAPIGAPDLRVAMMVKLRDADISSKARCLGWAIVSWMDEACNARPGRQLLGRLIGVRKSSIADLLDELVGAGLFSVEVSGPRSATRFCGQVDYEEAISLFCKKKRDPDSKRSSGSLYGPRSVATGSIADPEPRPDLKPVTNLGPENTNLGPKILNLGPHGEPEEEERRRGESSAREGTGSQKVISKVVSIGVATSGAHEMAQLVEMFHGDRRRADGLVGVLSSFGISREQALGRVLMDAGMFGLQNVFDAAMVARDSAKQAGRELSYYGRVVSSMATEKGFRDVDLPLSPEDEAAKRKRANIDHIIRTGGGL